MPRFIKNILIIGYLWVTALGFIMTLLHVYVPLAPFRLVFWAYGMMAPYQSDDPDNYQIVATGHFADGSTLRINTEKYLPYGPGERSARELYHLHSLPITAFHRARFVKFGLQLLELERRHGHDFVSVDIALHIWGRSPAGFEFLHQPLFTTIVPIVTVQ
jgi:hypothetical protein